MPICRIDFNGQLKPFVGDQTPGVDIFWCPGVNCPIQTLLSILPVSVRRHTDLRISGSHG